MIGSPARGAVRAVRVGSLGATSMTLATTAHLLGGGPLPPAGVLVVSGLLVGLVAGSATARRCRFGVLVALLAVEQALLHWLFSTAAATTGCDGGPIPGAHHGGALGAMGCVAGTGEGMGRAALGLAAPAMWLAHSAAVLATAWLLARGEAWLWRTADRVVSAATATPTDRSARRRAVRPPAVMVSDLPMAPVSPGAPTRAAHSREDHLGICATWLAMMRRHPRCSCVPPPGVRTASPSRPDDFSIGPAMTSPSAVHADVPGRRRHPRSRCHRRRPHRSELVLRAAAIVLLAGLALTSANVASAHVRVLGQHRIRILQRADFPGSERGGEGRDGQGRGAVAPGHPAALRQHQAGSRLDREADRGAAARAGAVVRHDHHQGGAHGHLDS